MEFGVGPHQANNFQKFSNFEDSAPVFGQIQGYLKILLDHAGLRHYDIFCQVAQSFL